MRKLVKSKSHQNNNTNVTTTTTNNNNSNTERGTKHPIEMMINMHRMPQEADRIILLMGQIGRNSQKHGKEKRATEVHPTTKKQPEQQQQQQQPHKNDGNNNSSSSNRSRQRTDKSKIAELLMHKETFEDAGCTHGSAAVDGVSTSLVSSSSSTSKQACTMLLARF